MNDNELLLQDRIQKIKQVILKYGEENFYISFSGGKDSCVVSDLIDWALPKNKIPRVYVNTGIELNMIRDFVYGLQKQDKRIVIIEPYQKIREMLEENGYPFKSKRHSKTVARFQRIGLTKGTENYINGIWHESCPKKLRYQFTEKNKLKISNLCCVHLKEEPLYDWACYNDISYTILGIRREEGGMRMRSSCLSFRNNKLFAFQPLSIVSEKWEEWFIKEFEVKICDIYKDPYNFPRTGCKGCPFNINLQKELDTLEEYFPAERKQCELIWKPVYDEYRRIGYRLK